MPAFSLQAFSRLGSWSSPSIQNGSPVAGLSSPEFSLSRTPRLRFLDAYKVRSNASVNRSRSMLAISQALPKKVGVEMLEVVLPSEELMIGTE